MKDAIVSNIDRSRQLDIHLQIISPLVVIGFGCLCGWEMTIMFSPVLPLTAFADTKFSIILYSVLLASSAVLAVMLYRLARRVQKNGLRPILLLAFLPLVGIVFSGLSAVVPIDFPVLALVVWILVGIGQAMLVIFWGITLSSMPSKRTAAAAASGSVLGTVMFVLISCIPNLWINLLGSACMLGAALAIGLFINTSLPKVVSAPATEYRISPPPAKSSVFSAVLYNGIFGFTLALLASYGFLPALIGAACGGIGAFAALLWARASRLSAQSPAAQYAAVPIIVIGLLLMIILTDTVGRTACCCALTVAHAFLRTSGFGALATVNSDFKLHPVRHTAQGMLPTVSGLFVGSFTGVMALFVFPVTEKAFELVIAMMIILIVLSVSVNGIIRICSRSSVRALLLIDEDEKVCADDSKSAGEGTNRDRVMAVAGACHLSPRESEVFALLVRGRNADYIQRHLVLAPGTVKTHIQHIYQKTGVNSRQDLLDLIDTAQPPVSSS
jgi:DNA-binding CsgD family transcriptional regulator